MGGISLLELWDPSVPQEFMQPKKEINDGSDLTRFFTTNAYRDIGIFLMQLNRSLCPRKRPDDTVQTFELSRKREDSQSVLSLQALLGRVEALIDDAPPDPGPRRFGNIAFRKWHELLGQQVAVLLTEFLSREIMMFGQDMGECFVKEDTEEAGKHGVVGPFAELESYFIGSFGSAQRLDYGTGHELSFLAFLGCLWKLGFFKDDTRTREGETERSIVLGVFEPYFKVVRRLILTYTLEPAGTHGVWGLDDHFFMPYIFGSAQLTRPITEEEPMPLEGSVPGAPKPADVTKAATVELYREENMYFAAIGFINDVKKGPFWEHSPILFDISGIKDGWGKINKGMLKMFDAEVLGKFPVVQHFRFGKLFSWDVDPNAPAVQHTVHTVQQPVAPKSSAVPGVGTAAPWAKHQAAPPMSGAAALRAQPAPPNPLYSEASIPASTGEIPGPLPRGIPGTASAQHSITKAPWAA